MGENEERKRREESQKHNHIENKSKMEIAGSTEKPFAALFLITEAFFPSVLIHLRTGQSFELSVHLTKTSPRSFFRDKSTLQNLKTARLSFQRAQI